MQAFKSRQKKTFDKHHWTHHLPAIPDDTEVWIHSGEKPIRERAASYLSSTRLYLVDTPTGTIHHNRFHLAVISEQSSWATEDQQPVPQKVLTCLQAGTEIQPPLRYPDKLKTWEGRVGWSNLYWPMMAMHVLISVHSMLLQPVFTSYIASYVISIHVCLCLCYWDRKCYSDCVPASIDCKRLSNALLCNNNVLMFFLIL